MCELLIKAVDTENPDEDKDRQGCYKCGMVAAVMPDGHEWGKAECLPKFAIIKIPGISVDKTVKYMQPHLVYDGLEIDGKTPKMVVHCRRLWVVQWANLPEAAHAKLENTGYLTIKAGEYTGDADYTWEQVKPILRNQSTGQDETADL
jgi:hypothetical protein